jgi:hypothetical protein
MFVGMDVHKNHLQVAVLDEKGKVLRITYIGYGTQYVVVKLDNIITQSD